MVKINVLDSIFRLQNQYQSIFNLVVLFLDSFSVYSNFK